MTSSSVEIYLRLKEELRPRPSKAHYTFNLRDLSKVFQGIMMAVPRTCSCSPQVCVVCAPACTCAVWVWVPVCRRCACVFPVC